MLPPMSRSQEPYQPSIIQYPFHSGQFQRAPQPIVIYTTPQSNSAPTNEQRTIHHGRRRDVSSVDAANGRVVREEHHHHYHSRKPDNRRRSSSTSSSSSGDRHRRHNRSKREKPRKRSSSRHHRSRRYQRSPSSSESSTSSEEIRRRRGKQKDKRRDKRTSATPPTRHVKGECPHPNCPLCRTSPSAFPPVVLPPLRPPAPDVFPPSWGSPASASGRDMVGVKLLVADNIQHLLAVAGLAADPSCEVLAVVSSCSGGYDGSLHLLERRHLPTAGRFTDRSRFGRVSLFGQSTTFAGVDLPSSVMLIELEERYSGRPLGWAHVPCVDSSRRIPLGPQIVAFRLPPVSLAPGAMLEGSATHSTLTYELSRGATDTDFTTVSSVDSARIKAEAELAALREAAAAERSRVDELRRLTEEAEAMERRQRLERDEAQRLLRMANDEDARRRAVDEEGHRRAKGWAEDDEARQRTLLRDSEASEWDELRGSAIRHKALIEARNVDSSPGARGVRAELEDNERAARLAFDEEERKERITLEESHRQGFRELDESERRRKRRKEEKQRHKRNLEEDESRRQQRDADERRHRELMEEQARLYDKMQAEREAEEARRQALIEELEHTRPPPADDEALERDRVAALEERITRKVSKGIPIAVQGSRRDLVDADEGVESDPDEFNEHGQEVLDTPSPSSGRNLGVLNLEWPQTSNDRESWHPLLMNRTNATRFHNPRAKPLLDSCEFTIDAMTGCPINSALARVAVYVVDTTDFTNGNVLGIPNTRKLQGDTTFINEFNAHLHGDRRSFASKILELFSMTPHAVFVQNPTTADILSPKMLSEAPLRCRHLSETTSFLCVLEMLEKGRKDRFVTGHALIPWYSKGARPGNYFSRVLRGPPREDTFLIAGHGTSGYMRGVAKVKNALATIKATGAFGAASASGGAGTAAPKRASLFDGSGNISSGFSSTTRRNRSSEDIQDLTGEKPVLTTEPADFVPCAALCFQIKRRVTLFEWYDVDSKVGYPTTAFNGYAPLDEASGLFIPEELEMERERYTKFRNQLVPPDVADAEFKDLAPGELSKLFATQPLWYDLAVLVKTHGVPDDTSNATHLFHALRAFRDVNSVMSRAASNRAYMPPVGFGTSSSGSIWDYSALTPFSPRRGFFLLVEQLRGMGGEAALFKVGVHMINSKEVFQFTNSHDLSPSSDLGAPYFSTADAMSFTKVEVSAPGTMGSIAVLRLYKVADPNISPDDRLQEVGWSVLTAFTEEGLLRNGRFILPWFKGHPSISVLEAIEKNSMPLAQIIASRLSNPASSVKLMEGNPVVVVSIGDPLRKHEFAVRRPVFRHIPKPLLISKFQFDNFPLQQEAGECGVPCVSLLRRPGLRKGDESDQVVAKRLLMEAKSLMEQYYKDSAYVIPNTYLGQSRRELLLSKGYVPRAK